MSSFYNALSPDGVFIAQMGDASDRSEQPYTHNREDLTPLFISGLEKAGFENIVNYEEQHARFGAPWSFLLAMKSGESRSNWYANEARWNLGIQKRTLRTRDGGLSLKFFDASAMMSYQYPTRDMEEVHCMNYPQDCVEKPWFDPYVVDIPVDSFEIKQSVVPNGGRGVFTKQFIPKDSYMGLEECVNGMFVPSPTLTVIDEMTDWVKGHEFWQCLNEGYIEGYGWSEEFYVSPLDVCE